MSNKLHLLKNAIIYLQEAVEYFKKNNKCGNFTISINFYNGGITRLNKSTDITEQ